MANATANPLSALHRSPKIGIENAYAKKAEQLYIAVTSLVLVKLTATNHVLAATVNVIVNVPITQAMYLQGVNPTRMA